MLSKETQQGACCLAKTHWKAPSALAYSRHTCFVQCTLTSENGGVLIKKKKTLLEKQTATKFKELENTGQSKKIFPLSWP